MVVRTSKEAAVCAPSQSDRTLWPAVSTDGVKDVERLLVGTMHDEDRSDLVAGVVPVHSGIIPTLTLSLSMPATPQSTLVTHAPNLVAGFVPVTSAILPVYTSTVPPLLRHAPCLLPHHRPAPRLPSYALTEAAVVGPCTSQVEL